MALFYADEEIYCSDGALFNAFSAAGAFFGIDLGTEIVYRDRTVFASLDALHTADTARLALLASEGALVVILTKHGGVGLLEREHFNESLGAGFNALAAGTASKGIYFCHAVAKLNCIIFAHSHAVSVTETAVNAFFRSAENLHCHAAALNSAVFELGFGISVMTAAKDDSRHGLYLSCGKTGDFSDSLCGIVSAGGTKSGIGGFSLGESGGVAVTARKSAGTAVGTGETFSDSLSLFVNGNGKNL